MDMQAIREWLIANGKTPEELDEVLELPVVQSIGEGLLMALQAADELGGAVVALMTEMDTVKQRLEALENA